MDSRGRETLDSEIDLTKTALLYGDHVTLHSPKLQPLTEMERALTNDPWEFLRFVSDNWEHEVAHPAQQILQNRRHISRAVVREFVERIKQSSGDLRPMWEQMGGPELQVATRARALTLDPIIRGRGANAAATVQQDVTAAIQRVLGRSTTYPLFDSTIRNVVAFQEMVGELRTSEAVQRRGRESGLASGITYRLPNFPRATMDEILDIRRSLSPYLGAFRTAVRELSEDIEAPLPSSEFDEVVQELWNSTVAPALDQLNSTIDDDRGLRDLALKPMAAAGAPLSGVVTLGITQSFYIAAAVGASMLTASALTEHRARTLRQRETKRAGFYFLHGANSQMGLA